MENLERKIIDENLSENENNNTLYPEEQEELNSLRKKQIDEEFTPEERERFLELVDKESKQKENSYNRNNNKSIFTDNELTELTNLRKKQINEEFTPEERDRFLELVDKESKQKNRRNPFYQNNRTSTLTEIEMTELKNLRKKQIEEEFTPEEKERFLELLAKEN